MMVTVDCCGAGRRHPAVRFPSIAVFDNIPLTALALKQGNYDWGGLAYAVGLRRLDGVVRLVCRRPVAGYLMPEAEICWPLA